jgi:hypothetical protein
MSATLNPTSSERWSPPAKSIYQERGGVLHRKPVMKRTPDGDLAPAATFAPDEKPPAPAPEPGDEIEDAAGEPWVVPECIGGGTFYRDYIREVAARFATKPLRCAECGGSAFAKEGGGLACASHRGRSRVSLSPPAQSAEHGQLVVVKQRLGLALGAALGSFKAAHHRTEDDFGGGGAREPLRSICFGNRRDAPDEGCQVEAICVSGGVRHNGFDGDRDSAILRVELCEIAQSPSRKG